MTRRTRRGALGAACASLLLACARPEVAPHAAAAAPQSRPAAPASLAVELYGGLDAGGAPSTDAPSPTPVAEFHVIAQDDPAHVLASGRTGQGAVAVPPGVVTLLVQLDPLERIGPFRLEPGDAARVRILDTFDAALPSRIWRLERGDEVVGHAFPPPDELPRNAP